MHSLFRSTCLAAVVLGITGCNDPVTIPTTPTPNPTTETFTGTLTVNGAVTHPFSAATAGSVTATLTTIGPDENPTVGLLLGTWNGSSCAVIIPNDAATRSTAIIGTVNQAGQLCVRIYDVGRITSPQTYEITVVHP